MQGLDIASNARKRLRGPSGAVLSKQTSQSPPEVHASKEESEQPVISIGDGPGRSPSGENIANVITVGSDSPSRKQDAGEAKEGEKGKESPESIRIGYEGNDGIVPPIVGSNGPTDPIPAPANEAAKEEPKESSRQHVPYGLPAVLELIRVLVTLIDPRNRNHTDTMHRVVALTLLQTGISVGGSSLGKWVGWGIECEKERQRKLAEATALKAYLKAEAASAAIATSIPVSTELKGEGDVDSNAVPSDEKSGTPISKVPPQKEAHIEEEIVIDETEEEKMAIVAKDLVVNELTKYLFQVMLLHPFLVNFLKLNLSAASSNQ
jgi:hypothetical protein